MTSRDMMSVLYGEDMAEQIMGSLREMILQALSTSELTLGQLQECLELESSATKDLVYTLARLESDGLVTNRQVGQQVFWRKE